MKLSEMIKVMQHFEDGGEINFREKESGKHWRKSNNPCWDWNNYEYQIKKPNVTIEKWLCQDRFGDFLIFETSNVDKHKQLEKIKLIESYEVEL